MTKKDYVRIAVAIAEAVVVGGISLTGRQAIVKAFCKTLSQDNQRFDCLRFSLNVDQAIHIGRFPVGDRSALPRSGMDSALGSAYQTKRRITVQLYYDESDPRNAGWYAAYYDYDTDEILDDSAKVWHPDMPRGRGSLARAQQIVRRYSREKGWHIMKGVS
jgi:hypothetical protein